MTRTDDDIKNTLHNIVPLYPEELRKAQYDDIDRITFHLRLLVNNATPGTKVCDIGGGIGLFSVGAAALGFDVCLLDDFEDAVNSDFGVRALRPHQQHHVRIESRNFVNEGIPSDLQEISMITSFDSIEHWHHSPRRSLNTAVSAMAAGGTILIGAPNCVNLRKRISVPLGYGKWSSMEEWYNRDVFRGHVREPDVEDLIYIAENLGLSDVECFGRNWLGLNSNNKMVRAGTRVANKALINFPSMCSDIYVLGRKKCADEITG